MRTAIVLLLALAGLSDLNAQSDFSTSELNFQDRDWVLVEIGSGGIREHLGREAVFLENSNLIPRGVDFKEGVIEFDLATEHASGFVGVRFRDNGEGTAEQFYVRFHQSGNTDATQYLGQMNGVASWQLHAGPNDAAAVELNTGEWIPIRIVVEDDKADIFVRDMETPLLHVPELRTDNDSGMVAFFASDRPEMTTGAYFSNLQIRDIAGDEGVRGQPREEPEVADDVIRTWEISQAFDEATLNETHTLDRQLIESANWRTVDVESNGILNISRYSPRAQGSQTVLVRTIIDAEAATSRQLNFGFSDRVRIYVNGRQQFYGTDMWRSRDYRFLGTVGLYDAVIIHLEPGENEIIAAVSESFGGWGFIGQLENRDGLKIRP